MTRKGINDGGFDQGSEQPRPGQPYPAPATGRRTEEEEMWSWFTSWKTRALAAERRCGELSQAILRLESDLQAVTGEKKQAVRERDNFDRRLSELMQQMSIADRGNLSLAGTDSQPERIGIDFGEYRKQMERLVRQTRPEGATGNPRDYVARAVATMSRLVFLHGAPLLFSAGSIGTAAAVAQVGYAFCSEMEAVLSETIKPDFEKAVSTGFELLRRVVFSTAPAYPGVVLFVPENSLYDPNKHELWPGSSEEPQAIIATTIYPGYQVGSEVYVKPTVTTTVPPVVAQASVDRLA